MDATEVEDPDAAYAVSWLTDAKPSERITIENRQLLKSEVGARAIIDLENWYERQWADGLDFKQELVALLDASKFGRKEYTPFQVYMKALYEYFRDELGGEVPTGTRSAVNLAEFQEDAAGRSWRPEGKKSWTPYLMEFTPGWQGPAQRAYSSIFRLGLLKPENFIFGNTMT